VYTAQSKREAFVENEKSCSHPLDIDLPTLALYGRDFDSGLPSPAPDYLKKKWVDSSSPVDRTLATNAAVRVRSRNGSLAVRRSPAISLAGGTLRRTEISSLILRVLKFE
jgi:hypothetical protein